MACEMVYRGVVWCGGMVMWCTVVDCSVMLVCYDVFGGVVSGETVYDWH